MERLHKRHFCGKWLTITVLASLGCSFPGPASAMSTDYVTGGGKTMFEVDFLDPGESIREWNTPSVYAWTPNLKRGIVDALSYWADILGPNAKNTAPLQVAVFTAASYRNADAASFGYHNGQERKFLWIQGIQNGETEYGRSLTWFNPVNSTTI